jgi:8-hydroxy-5-deazaflavin:NADPH oxidoreductase
MITNRIIFSQFESKNKMIHGSENMKITVIGSGNMASGFVKQLSRAGHSVQIYARNEAKAGELAKAYNAKVIDAKKASQADIIILAVPYKDAVDALKNIGPLKGNVIVDITNPLNEGAAGLSVGQTTSAAEEISKAFPEAIVVKAFNTVFAQRLGVGPDLAGDKIPVYIASDDASAKRNVTKMIGSMGFITLDAGPLRNARYLEPLGALNIYFGYGAGMGTAIAPTWLIEKRKDP